MPTILRSHPLRTALNDEAHARPAPPVPTPSCHAALTFWFGQDDRGQVAALQTLAAGLGLPPPADDCVQYDAGNDTLTLSWSLHTEFVRYRFSRSGSGSALAGIDPALFAGVPGQLLAAMHVTLEHAGPEEALPGTPDRLHGMIGSDIADGEARVMTDLRLYEDPQLGVPFTRLVIHNRHMRDATAGRMLGRLFEQECYRMLALLALPVAKQQMKKLDALDGRMRQLTREVAAGGNDRLLLDRLSALAAELEDNLSESQYRFAAARAYYRLVERRIGELREIRTPGVQPFREFIERRLAPAMETCASAETRQARLAERIARTSALLHTRVDIVQEQQSQQLLASMDRRAALQLRLQQTVEGLSVAVLTYYGAGLVAYLAKAVKALHLIAVEPDLVAGCAIPLLALAVWRATHRVRRAPAGGPTGYNAQTNHIA